MLLFASQSQIAVSCSIVVRSEEKNAMSWPPISRGHRMNIYELSGASGIKANVFLFHGAKTVIEVEYLIKERAVRTRLLLMVQRDRYIRSCAPQNKANRNCNFHSREFPRLITIIVY